MTVNPPSEEPSDPNIVNRSGGVEIDADQAKIGGDVVGRDKIVDQSIHVHVEHAASAGEFASSLIDASGPPATIPPAPIEPAQSPRNSLVGWYLLGLAILSVVVGVFFAQFRCLIEYRLTESITTLFAFLAAGIAAAVSLLVSQPIRKKLWASYGGIASALTLWVIVTIILPPVSIEQCFPTPTITPTLTAVFTPTARSSSTPLQTTVATFMPTFTPTPDPQAELLRLIETERQAVLSRNLNLLSTTYSSDATKTDAVTGVSAPVMSEYARTFSNEQYQWVTHTNFQIDVSGDTATVTNDSCGQYHLVAENSDLSFNCPQCDRWRFKRDDAGRWWITDFTYNLQATAAQHHSAFEDGTHGCWVVRIDQNVPQGSEPVFTQERAAQGQGALRLALDLSASVPRSQIVRWNMPFAGRATAQVYAPPDAPDDLVAGFFAMEYDHEPWNYHAADQLITLKRGAWTTVTWNVSTTGWAQPLHLLGLEVRRANNQPYRGYVIIDEVVIDSQ